MVHTANAFILSTGDQMEAPMTQDRCFVPLMDSGLEPISVAMRVMDLSIEEAQELRERLEHPVAFPTLPPRRVPIGDPSFLRQR